MRELMPVQIIDAGGPHEKVTVEVMRSQRFCERVGIQIERTYVTNGAEAAELLSGGRGDVAMQVGFGPALVAIENGAPLRVIAGSNLLTVHALYSKRSQIRRLQDLRGRTVGVGRLGALTHQLMYAVLRKHGVDPAEVRFVPIGNSATIFKALLAGKIDAGFGETDVFENQAHYGVHALEDGVLWEELPEFPNQASFATQAALRTKREAIVRTLAAHALLYRFLHHPDSWIEYAAAWAKALPNTDLAEGRAQWSFYQRHQPFAVNLELAPEKLAYMQDINVTMGLQRRVLAFDEAADMSLAQDALRFLEEIPNE